MERRKLRLIEQKCTSCASGMGPLKENKVKVLLKELGGGWSINAIGHLVQEYKFKNFSEAIAFGNKVASIAEAEGHHPDLHISWGKCTVEIWTHKVNGLTESDFILAAKIDSIQV